MDQIKSLAEEAAYSSKGHFKSADTIKHLKLFFIAVPIVTSLVTFGFELTRSITQTLSCLGLIFSSAALYALKDDSYMQKQTEHMKLGNEYLALYKDLRHQALSNSFINEERLDIVRSLLNELDSRSSSYPIGFLGRKWSKMSINKEMDLGWLKN